ncbi:hypothetical protein, conserved [Eimeria praecox]|uniref:Uncharacterized protein n=1 Tax=Eimeria praecox TaxID=51316 RepID=U6H9E7_9EIME|nr:hypothetical protein, conserved [Eimeria praecox]
MEGEESLRFPAAGGLPAAATPAAAEQGDASATAAAKTAATGAGGGVAAAAHVPIRISSGTSKDRVHRLTGSLSTVFLLLHIHFLPIEPRQQQQQHQRRRQQQQQQQLEDVHVDAASITRSFTAALLQHSGLVGAAMLPFRVLSYDSRLSLAVIKTDSASAPTLILAAANIRSLQAVAAVSSSSITVPCFLTLVRTAATLHALACPRRPNAMLLIQGDPHPSSSTGVPQQQRA